MNRRTIILGVAGFMLCAATILSLFAGGTVTESVAQSGSVRYVALAWTSSTSQGADATVHLDGEIVRVVFKPSATAAPTADYDVTLKDVEGVDLLAGKGANLSASAAYAVKPGVAFTDNITTSIAPVCVYGNASLLVTNAGAAKSGWVIIYLR